MDQDTKLSIIISTFNRAILLEQLLEDLSDQISRLSEPESQQIEIVLIDNNCTDNTKEVAYRYSESTLVNLKYHVEEKQGLARARNLGIKHAKGDLIAFLDDDLTLDEEWLKEAYEIAKICKDSEIGIYGGRIVPLWQERTPKWLSTEGKYATRQEVFSGHSFGDEERFYPLVDDSSKPIKEQHTAHFPTGTNVMFRKEIFENCGDFRTDLGINAAGGVGLHEDLEFFDYLSALNIPMLYIPRCTAFHPVTHEKMSKHYIRRWYFKSGRSMYWMKHTDRMRREPEAFFAVAGKYKPFFPGFSKHLKIDGAPLYLYMKSAALFLWWMLSHTGISSKKTFWIGLAFSRAWGEIAGAKLVNKYVSSKKFSFKERLEAKKLVEMIPQKES